MPPRVVFLEIILNGCDSRRHDCTLDLLPDRPAALTEHMELSLNGLPLFLLAALDHLILLHRVFTLD